MEPPFSRTQPLPGWVYRLRAGSVEEVRMKRVILMFVLLLALTPGLAQGATQQATGVMKNWKTGDNCAKQAQAAFPDFTPEANAKRDAKLKECLEANRLAPRESLSPGR
jgi:hypothetical protein